MFFEGRKRGLLRVARAVAYAWWVVLVVGLAWPLSDEHGAYLKCAALIVAGVLVLVFSEMRWREDERKEQLRAPKRATMIRLPPSPSHGRERSESPPEHSRSRGRTLPRRCPFTIREGT
jgi:hypothetical protein